MLALLKQEITTNINKPIKTTQLHIQKQKIQKEKFTNFKSIKAANSKQEKNVPFFFFFLLKYFFY